MPNENRDSFAELNQVQGRRRGVAAVPRQRVGFLQSMALQVSGLSRRVPGQPSALFTDVSLSVARGGVAVVRAPSGSGKTLLLRLLALLDRVPEGASLRLDGQSVEEVGGAAAWRARVAYVSQSRVGLRGTVGALFSGAAGFKSQGGQGSLGSRQGSGALLAELLEATGLSADVVGRHWSDLSGGEFQRALLCVTLALAPDVLLLDEPTSACDPESAAKVERAVLSAGCTVVWVSHDPGQEERLRQEAEGAGREHQVMHLGGAP